MKAFQTLIKSHEIKYVTWLEIYEDYILHITSSTILKRCKNYVLTSSYLAENINKNYIIITPINSHHFNYYFSLISKNTFIKIYYIMLKFLVDE